MNITRKTLVCFDSISLMTFGAFLSVNEFDAAEIAEIKSDLALNGFAVMGGGAFAVSTLALCSPIDNVARAYHLTARGGDCDAIDAFTMPFKYDIGTFDANYIGSFDSRKAFDNAREAYE